VLDLILPRPDETIAPWHFSALAMFLQSTRSQRQGPADSPEMQKRIDRVKRAAGEIVGDEKKESATREAALRLAGSDPSAVSRIVEIARTTPSSTMQKAALAVLKNSRSAETSRLLLKDWTKAAPAFRAVVVDILMARQEWMNDLLEAIEQQTVIPGEISIANRQRLLQHPNATIQRRASMLFAGRNQESRTRILEQYAAVPALKGDAKNGALVFEKNCATCHALRGVGHAVGPDLAGWRDKSVQDFLVAILDPSAAIEPRFINYQIETVDGRSLSGIIEGETATIVTLAQPGGVTEKLLRSQIAEIRALPLSLMPEGLEQAMTPQELADLIAWFKN
jgi:putative heme-binding domain-containing protein